MAKSIKEWEKEINDSFNADLILGESTLQTIDEIVEESLIRMYSSVHKLTGKTDFSFPIRFIWPFYCGELKFSASCNRLAVSFSRREVIGTFKIDKKKNSAELFSTREENMATFIKMLVSGRILKSFNDHMGSLVKEKSSLDSQRAKLQYELDKFSS